MAAAVQLCTFLATFIILAMVLASAIVGPQFLQPEAHISCTTFAQLAAAQGAPSSLPCPKDALHLYKVAQVLGAISVACLFFGCINQFTSPIFFFLKKKIYLILVRCIQQSRTCRHGV